MTSSSTSASTSDDPQQLADELATLRARNAIIDVIQRYALAVDGRDPALLRACFADDATADYVDRQQCPTPEHLVDWVLNAVGRYDLTHHLNGVPDIQIDAQAGTAQSTTYLQAVHVRPTDRGSSSLIIGGIYQDRFRLTEDGWLIAHRRFESIWSHNMEAGRRG